MSKDNSTIHDFDFKLICNFFSLLERQGPGSEEATIKALSFIENLPADACIADIGCGTGGQTITLAQNTTGQITAIDLFPDFINILKVNADKAGYKDRIKTLVGSMDDLPFKENELDLIWAEGSIYNIGFERGMNEWKKYLKPGGYIAVSESSWFTLSRPKEIEDFWMNAYPEMDLISPKVQQMEAAGYKVVAAFALTEECWINNYFAPAKQAREKFLEKYGENKGAQQFVTLQEEEEVLYNKYKDYYGYVFYIGQKPVR